MHVYQTKVVIPTPIPASHTLSLDTAAKASNDVRGNWPVSACRWMASMRFASDSKFRACGHMRKLAPFRKMLLLDPSSKCVNNPASVRLSSPKTLQKYIKTKGNPDPGRSPPSFRLVWRGKGCVLNNFCSGVGVT